MKHKEKRSKNQQKKISFKYIFNQALFLIENMKRI